MSYYHGIYPTPPFTFGPLEKGLQHSRPHPPSLRAMADPMHLQSLLHHSKGFGQHRRLLCPPKAQAAFLTCYPSAAGWLASGCIHMVAELVPAPCETSCSDPCAASAHLWCTSWQGGWSRQQPAPRTQREHLKGRERGPGAALQQSDGQGSTPPERAERAAG